MQQWFLAMVPQLILLCVSFLGEEQVLAVLGPNSIGKKLTLLKCTLMETLKMEHLLWETDIDGQPAWMMTIHLDLRQDRLSACQESKVPLSPRRWEMDTDGKVGCPS